MTESVIMNKCLHDNPFSRKSVAVTAQFFYARRQILLSARLSHRNTLAVDWCQIQWPWM